MSQQPESVLNRVLIDMGRSFLQYISEAWPWVDPLSQSLQDQVMVIGARQRQDVGDIAQLLTEREQFIDFGTFPTEYTDLQFMSLDKVLAYIHQSQTSICDSISSGLVAVQDSGDEAAIAVLKAIEIRQKEATSALQDLHQQLTEASAK